MLSSLLFWAWISGAISIPRSKPPCPPRCETLTRRSSSKSLTCLASESAWCPTRPLLNKSLHLPLKQACSQARRKTCSTDASQRCRSIRPRSSASKYWPRFKPAAESYNWKEKHPRKVCNPYRLPTLLRIDCRAVNLSFTRTGQASCNNFSRAEAPALSNLCFRCSTINLSARSCRPKETSSLCS